MQYTLSEVTDMTILEKITMGYHVVDYFNIVPLDLDFDASVNICPMLFLFVDARINYTLIIKLFFQRLYDVSYDLHSPYYSVLIVAVDDIGIKCETHAFWLTGGNVLLHMVSASVFFFFKHWLFLFVKVTKYKSGAT